MTTKRTTLSDEEFARRAGIRIDSSPCDMCDLLSQESHRNAALIADPHSRIAAREQTISKHRRSISMWQLATFAGILMAVMFAFASLSKGVA